MAYLVNVKIGRHYAYVVHFLSETILYIAEDWNFYKARNLLDSRHDLWFTLSKTVPRIYGLIDEKQQEISH